MTVAKGISISVASDTRDFLRGVKTGVLEPLEDVTDALKDVERESDTAGSALEDAMRDGQRKTEDAADEVKDLKDALRDAERNAKDMGRAGKDAGDDVRDGMRRAEDGVNDFREEAQSSARESAASFRGGFDEIADLGQEVLANAFTGFGPAGAAAGLAAAAGLGLAVGAYEAIDEANRESQERITEWAQRFVDAGSTVLNSGSIVAAMNDIILDAEKYAEAGRAAEQWGVSTETAVLAMAGNQTAIEDVSSSIDSMTSEYEDLVAANVDAGERFPQMANGAQALGQQVDNATTSFSALTSEMEQGSERASLVDSALLQLAQTTAGAQEAVDEFGDSVYSLPDGTTVYVDAETGQATTDVDAIENRIYGIPDGSSTINVATGPVNASTVNAYVASRPSATLTIFARTQAGVPIPV